MLTVVVIVSIIRHGDACYKIMLSELITRRLSQWCSQFRCSLKYTLKKVKSQNDLSVDPPVNNYRVS